MAVVFIPSLMRDLTGGAPRIEVPAGNLQELLDELDQAYPGMKARLVDAESGRLKPEIVAAIDGETEHLGMLEPLGERTEVHFIPAIGGGSDVLAG